MASTPTSSRAHDVISAVCAVVAIISPAALVTYLVGSLILSGAKVSPTMDAKWNAVIPYPLFPVPTIVLMALAILSVILVIAVVATARAVDEPGLRGLIGPLAASIVASIGFAGLVPDGGSRVDGVVWGDQWKAAIVFGVAIVVLLIGVAIVRIRSAAKSSAAQRPSV